jgi:methanogenic corrinoid protein MtbC1
MSGNLSKDLADLRRDEVLNEIRRRVDSGENLIQTIEECCEGMVQVGNQYQKDECFLAELILSAEIFKQAIEIMEPHLPKVHISKQRGRIVLATPKGDIHD